MTRIETNDLLEALLEAYKKDINNTSAYGAFSGFMMGLAGNMLSDMSLGGDYWIDAIKRKIEILKSKP